MAENARPPIALRVVRPYETEEAFLDSELETVGKTSVILIGAHSRPTGVILRFEVTLASGATVLRGEGRVLAHKESAFRGQPGLALRFTRLDPKSKALVDRAAAIREARLAGDAVPEAPPSSHSLAPTSTPPHPTPPVATARPAAPTRSMPPQRPTAPPDPALTEALTAPTPPPASVAPAPSASVTLAPSASIAPAPTASPPPASVVPAATASIAPQPAASLVEVVEAAPRSAPASSDREALLARLRQRAAGLTDEQKAAIWSHRREQTS